MCSCVNGSYEMIGWKAYVCNHNLATPGVWMSIASTDISPMRLSLIWWLEQTVVIYFGCSRRGFQWLFAVLSASEAHSFLSPPPPPSRGRGGYGVQSPEELQGCLGAVGILPCVRVQAQEMSNVQSGWKGFLPLSSLSLRNMNHHGVRTILQCYRLKDGRRFICLP